MAAELELTPKIKRPAGEPCSEPVVYPEVQREQAVRIAGVAKALGDPVRLRLACCLLAVPRGACVCELVDALDVPQPNVSRHLKVLKGARLVEERRDGRWMYYHLRPPDQPVLERIRSCLETVSGCADLQVDLRRLRARLDLRRDGRCVLGTRMMSSRSNAGRGGERSVRLPAAPLTAARLKSPRPPLRSRPSPLLEVARAAAAVAGADRVV